MHNSFYTMAVNIEACVLKPVFSHLWVKVKGLKQLCTTV